MGPSQSGTLAEQTTRGPQFKLPWRLPCPHHQLPPSLRRAQAEVGRLSPGRSRWRWGS